MCLHTHTRKFGTSFSLARTQQPHLGPNGSPSLRDDTPVILRVVGNSIRQTFFHHYRIICQRDMNERTMVNLGDSDGCRPSLFCETRDQSNNNERRWSTVSYLYVEKTK